MSNKKLTPKLRFPEFRKAGEWATEPMGNLYSFMRNNILSRDKLNYVSGTVKNIHYGDIHTKFPALFDITKERVPFINPTEPVPPDDSEDYCVEGDLIFADASEDTNDVGKNIEIVKLNGERLLSGQHTILARRNDDRIIVGFGGYLFRSGIIRSQIQRESQGTKVYQISSTRLANIEIAFPDEDEQRKIADCLSSLDELIAAEGQKLESLRAYKKGLMQQLFPRAGECVPQLRFPEFSDAGEWVAKPFEDFVVRSFYGTSSSTSETGKYPVLRMGNMVDGALVFSDLVYLDLDRESFENIRLIRGDILLNRTNSLDLVGKIAMFDRDIECITASYIVTYRLDTERFNPAFCNAMLNTPRYQAKIRLLARPSVSQANINPTTFKKELIVAVPSPAEQQRIADCLSLLDAQISAQSEKHAALRTHKKGLMQQLFPSTAEDEE